MKRLDTVRAVETPEGLELRLRPAGPVSRFWALLIDQLILWAVLLLSMIPLAFLGPIGMGAWVLLFFIGTWFYPVLFEVLGEGRTPGKRALRLKVLMRDGTPVGWGPSLLRNLIRFVDALPGAYTLGLLAVLATRDLQRLGDLVADTWVVHDEAASPRVQLPDAQPEPLPVAFSLEEQQVLLAFAERRATLSAARARELADLLEPLHGLRGEAALERLLGHAAHLRGTEAG